MSRALSNRFARLEGNSRGGETGVVVFPLRLDADRAAREADLTRSGVACASDCFLPGGSRLSEHARHSAAPRLTSARNACVKWRLRGRFASGDAT
jgi:hypothetical protein